LMVEYRDRPTIIRPTLTTEQANAILYPHRYAKNIPSEVDGKPIVYAPAENEMFVHIVDNKVKDIYWQPSTPYLKYISAGQYPPVAVFGGDPILAVTTLEDGTMKY